MLTINDPQILSEVRSAFDAYEAALLANDVPALQSFFWNSPCAIRYGATEELYGYAAIAAFRRDRIVDFSRRRGRKLELACFGSEMATVMYEYDSDAGGYERRGRQSQTWIKVGGEWKIAAAHVSFSNGDAKANEYIRHTLARLGLAPDPDWFGAIEDNFRAASSMADGLMQFPLPPELEPAPVFEA